MTPMGALATSSRLVLALNQLLTTAQFIDTFGMDKTGQFWAPRGPGDIGTAEPVLGVKDKLPTPLQLPW